MIKILICDDDKMFCELLTQKINNILQNQNIDFSLNCVLSFDELLKTKEEQDILFLDVILNGENAINMLSQLKIKKALKTVIITSYPGEIYNISNIKPDWYIDKLKMTNKHIERCLNYCIKELANRKTIIVTTKDKLNRTIDLNNVVYIEAQNKTTVFYLASGEKLQTIAKFGDVIKNTSNKFQQCSRSYAVNFDYVVAFKYHKYILYDNREVTISRQSYNEKINQYKNYLER